MLRGRIEDGVVEIYRQLTGSRFPFDEQKFRDKLKPVITHGNNPFALHVDAVGASPDRTSRLNEIKVPALIIHGTEDAPYLWIMEWQWLMGLMIQGNDYGRSRS